MKKLLSIATLILLAIAASLSFTSCSNDDPDPSPTVVTYSGKTTVSASSNSAIQTLAGKLQTYFQEELSGLATSVSIEAYSNGLSYGIGITIKSTSTKADDLKAKLAVIQYASDDLNNVVAGVDGINAFKAVIYDGDTTIFNYVYAAPYSIFGTWQATNAAGEKVLVNVEKTANEDDEYTATVTIGEKTYTGIMAIMGNQCLFESDEKGPNSTGFETNVLRVYIYLDSDTTVSGKIDLLSADSVESVTFTKITTE